MFDFAPWPSYSKKEIDAVSKVLLSNKVNYWTGNECRKFESEFATWSGSKYAIALSNGTMALDLALRAINLDNEDEVIVTSRTFIASVSSIVNSGAIPIFADVDINSQNITSESISSLITKKTKAIVCVHLAGWPCEMDKIMSLAKKFNLFVIEDCAQAHGAEYLNKSVGSFGHIGCWSFCQDKIMSTGGEGGMVTTSDESLWRFMWAYKDHGKSYEAIYEEKQTRGFKWVHKSFGTNMRMTEIQAVIGRIQLKKMNSWSLSRLSNANKIWDTARNCYGLNAPIIPDNIKHAAYKCYIFIDLKLLKSNWDQIKIINAINLLGVPCYSGSCSEVYLEEAFIGLNIRPTRRLVNAKLLGETSLMFLVHPTLTDHQINQTCDAIKTVMKKATLEQH